jgi:hypothetical protein
LRVAGALAAWREQSGQAAAPPGRTPWFRLFWVKVGPIAIPVPHPGQLHWHDLHHLVLGYRTDLVGEMEISAFELRTKPRTFVVLLLCVAGVVTGMIWAPRRTIAAWRRGAGARNLYGAELDYDALMKGTVAALAAWMRVESAAGAGGPARHRPGVR